MFEKGLERLDCEWRASKFEKRELIVVVVGRTLVSLFKHTLTRVRFAFSSSLSVERICRHFREKFCFPLAILEGTFHGANQQVSTQPGHHLIRVDKRPKHREDKQQD